MVEAPFVERRDIPHRGCLLALCAVLLLTACGTVSHGTPRQYAQKPGHLDTVSNACLKNPANCPPVVGERVSVGRPLKPPLPPVAGLPFLAAAVIQVSHSLDEDLQSRIDEALAECAGAARSAVMIKHFQRSPTHKECNEQVGTGSQGEPITRAMQLGVEQHAIALQCAEQRLNELKPGGFSIKPRYHVDPQTGQAKYMPREVLEALLKQGRSAELRGTIEPDIVIHEGQPHRIQDVYDYKFPCVNTSKRSGWREYPEGTPHGGKNQGDVYKKALGGKPARVQPHLGVYR
jgi:hypothetical protein